MSQSHHTIIIGSGFSGTLAAVHLLRDPAAKVTIIERSGRFGPGLAYGTNLSTHALNVPAGNMSALDSDPGHFLRWAQSRDPSISTGTFVPRAMYGTYLQDLLGAAQVAAGPRLQPIHGEATQIKALPKGFELTIVPYTESATRTIHADAVLLALGNFPPSHPPLTDLSACTHPAYVRNPFDVTWLDGLAPDDPVFIIGSGLTMMDVVMSLQTHEHMGRVIALSRRGLLSRPHRSPSRPPAHRPPPAELRTWDGRTRSLVRIMRNAVRESATKGTDWRDVITSVRPITASLWQRMPPTEQARFLHRIRSFWEIARHRAAPETAAAVADLLASRRLSLRAGRVLAMKTSNQRIDVTFRPRGSLLPQTFSAARVINCMGPECDLRRVDQPLVRSLLATGLAVPDDHGLGFTVNAQGQCVSRSGKAVDGLFVIGALRKGQTWENTAVPELKMQAAELARKIIERSRPTLQ